MRGTDVLGSAAFKPVKSDMVGNIKVCIRYNISGVVMVLMRPENPRPTAGCPHPLGNPPGPRPQRAEGEEAHSH